MKITQKVNELIPHGRVNAPYAYACKVFGVQLYKNNADALLSRILGILNSDWQHAHSVCGVYEF